MQFFRLCMPESPDHQKRNRLNSLRPNKRTNTYSYKSIFEVDIRFYPFLHLEKNREMVMAQNLTFHEIFPV